MVKNPPANAGDLKGMGSIPRGWVGEVPLEKKMATHSSILVCRSHGQRILAGYSSV